MAHAVQDVVSQMRNAGHTDDARAAKYLRVVVGKQTPKKFYSGTANKWRVDADKLHAAVLAHFDGVPNAIENEVQELRDALRWVMNVVHGCSRVDGGPLRSGEAEAAFENALRVLDGDA